MQPKIVDIDSAPTKTDIDLLHEIGSRIAAADPLHTVLARVVQFVTGVVRCDSCFVYVLEQHDLVLTLRTISEDRLTALRQVLEEKLVKRGVSLKGLDYAAVEAASHNTVRQVVTIKVGISSDKAREINKLIKEKAPKGVSSQTQGEMVRVSSKKRDDLQAVMAAIKAADLGIPVQFENMRN